MPDDPLGWETLDSETVYRCPGFDVINEDVRLPDGTVTDFDYVEEGESVVVLPFTEDGAVVVIDEWRHPVGRTNRALPAGSIEADDESIAAAARRELTEETGYEAGSVQHLTSFEAANGFADSVFHYVLATDCTDTGTRQLDHNESISVETTTFETLVDALGENRLRDGRTALGLLYYDLFERATA